MPSSWRRSQASAAQALLAARAAACAVWPLLRRSQRWLHRQQCAALRRTRCNRSVHRSGQLRVASRGLRARRRPGFALCYAMLCYAMLCCAMQRRMLHVAGCRVHVASRCVAPFELRINLGSRLARAFLVQRFGQHLRELVFGRLHASQRAACRAEQSAAQRTLHSTGTAPHSWARHGWARPDACAAMPCRTAARSRPCRASATPGQYHAGPVPVRASAEPGQCRTGPVPGQCHAGPVPCRASAASGRVSALCTV